MGLYINPEGESKEQWLVKCGVELFDTGRLFESGQVMEPKHYPVCLVYNGFFTAAAICFSQREYEVFAEPDGRLKRWFLVNEDDLDAVAGLRDYLGSRGAL